jgi:hypothetical protein
MILEQLMVTAAHRYCLGRCSYIVGACLGWLYATWDQFDRNTKRVMVRDTIEALMDDRAGGYTDVKDWTKFASWSFVRLVPEDQEWVREVLTYKNKAWPI